MPNEIVNLHNESVTNTAIITAEQKELIEKAINTPWTMPEFKAKHFVGNAQITPYAELKQYLIELNAREGTVELLEYEYKKMEIEKQLEEEKLAAARTPAERKMCELEISRLERNLKRKQNGLFGAYRERQLFIDLIEKFNASDRGKLPDGRLIMLAVHEDPSIAEELEKHYWTIRLAKQTAMDMIAYGRAGVGNMDAVTMLPKEQQEEVMQLACDLFVRSEVRNQQMLSVANERLQLGLEGAELVKQLGVETKAREDVYLIQSDKQ
jgi:hypothetical protein